MPNHATAATTPGRTGPPWTAEGTVYFYGGPLSNFAPTPGLRLPFGYHGHHERDRVPVASTEHWFQACKATSRAQFDVILASGSAAIAKHAGRQTELRADWEQVKFQVMLAALRGKFALEPYRSALLLTHPRPLAENSPDDFVWGCRDPEKGYRGQNLLGLALMQVRDELVADVRTRLRALVPASGR
jgi:N-glycosidase YbiA